MSWETEQIAKKQDTDIVVATALAAATEISEDAKSHIGVVANMASATWNTVGSHEVFTVTGAVRIRIWIYVKETLTDAANNAHMEFGYEGQSNAFLNASNAAGRNGKTMTVGDFWYRATGTDPVVLSSSIFMDWCVGAGKDIGYELKGEALTGGVLEFHCVWEALNSTGNVIAGTGVAL